MKITGIIAEYNPFHNGHAHHIACARKEGATHVVCVMSGNFTQRGDAAVLHKLTRARCALAGGADLVIELPVVHALAPAADFARGSVETLLAMGCVDSLHFGSECGAIEPLKETALAIEEMEARGLVETSGNTAAARGQALTQHGYAQQAHLLESPNNLLGVEYLLALRRRQSHILPETIARLGCEHDSLLAQGEICSASHLRRMLVAEQPEAWQFMPEQALKLYRERQLAGQAPIMLKQLDVALLSRLRMMEPGYLSRVAGVSEGLENRLYEAIRHSQSLEEIGSAVKTKRYPLSRIRRILLCAAIGITKQDRALSPAYIRVLAQTEKGNDVLRLMRNTAKLPVILRAADAENLSAQSKRIFKLENAAADLYTMAYTPMGECGTEYTQNLYRFTKGGGLGC